MRQKKKRKAVADSAMVSLSLLFPKGSELGPDVAEETRVAMGGLPRR